MTPVAEAEAVVHLPVISETPESYFRSRIYTSQSGSNPLLMAAQPILSFLLRYTEQDAEHPGHLEKNLAYELKAFAAYIRTFAYSDEAVTCAQYIVASLLQAQIKNIHWLQYTDIKNKPQYQGKKLPATKLHKGYFQLMELLSADAKSNVNLLELCYQGLALGIINHRQSGEKLEQLYQTIIHVSEPTCANTMAHKSANNTTDNKPIIAHKAKIGLTITLLTLTSLLVVTYWGLNYVIDLSAEQLSQQIITIKQQLAELGRTF